MTWSSGCTGVRSALDLWHSTASPRHRLAIGRAAQPVEEVDTGDAVDVAVIAPDADEVTRSWLEQAISRAASRLSPDAVLWVIVPRRWRRSAERMLDRTHLTMIDAVLTVPTWPHTTHLIPVEPRALRYSAPRHLQVSGVLTTFLASLSRLRPAQVALRRGARGCALVAACRPTAARFRWLGETNGAEPATAMVTIGPRRDARVAVVMRFTRRGSRPDLAVKVALDEGGAQRLEHEREALEALGPEARLAGAIVPWLRPTTMPWVLATGALEGHPASGLLATRPDRLEPIAQSVAAWLEAWGVATASTVTASRDLLDQVLLDSAKRVAEIDGAELAEYIEVLCSLAVRVERRPVVLAAAHNDLTMSNVLMDGDRCGVVDWEVAVPAALPLLDLWYALADSIAHARRLDHARAVEALVLGNPAIPSALVRLPAEHAHTLGLSGEEAALSFHACWVNHAATELERGIEDGPFLNVVRSVAAGRLVWPGGGALACP